VDDGIRITNAYDNLIGGNSVEHRNILSGNLDDGVEINGTSAYDNVIRGNLIGIGANGSTNLANGDDGVAIRNGAYQNTIGGLNSGEGNVISFNSDEGILIDVSSNNSIIGNSIGTDLTGELNCGNNGHGIYILNSDANQIGAFGALSGILSALV